nr:MAG TPA: protein of unknown function (DUF4451) [Crassvirales sp.]
MQIPVFVSVVILFSSQCIIVSIFIQITKWNHLHGVSKPSARPFIRPRLYSVRRIMTSKTKSIEHICKSCSEIIPYRL